MTALAIGTDLHPQGRNLLPSALERIFESERPDHHPARHLSVFMAFAIDTVEAMGLADGYLYYVRPAAPPLRLHATWLEQAHELWSRSDATLSKRAIRQIRLYARSYWSGAPTDYPSWKFLTSRATIVGLFQ